MREFKIKNFLSGLYSAIEAKSTPEGSASKCLNFITQADKIELRRGMKLLGTQITGNGKITGLGVGERQDGVETLFISYARKLKYYDEATDDFIEIGTDQLAAAASGEDVAFAPYFSPAGSQMFVNSPNSSLYKIMVANPTSITDLYDATKNYKGKIKVKQNRMYLWNRIKDRINLYLSYIDKRTYTTVTAENIGTGDGATKTFAETLDFKAAGATRTCFGITATDGTETFTDNYNGVLTGDLGGTGTINYTTGAISVTFNTAPANSQAITATYQWENSNSGGVTDFTYSATRLAGEGDIIPQGDKSSPLMSIESYGDTDYCLHEKITWGLTLTNDDTNANNNIWREKMGIPNWRAAVATGNGVYFIDDSDEENPKFRLATIDPGGSTQIIPISISENITLEDYRFASAASIEFGDLIIFTCRHKNYTYNNRMFVYNKKYKSFDLLDYFVSCFAIYNGSLYGGDSISNNVYQLFSGLDDDDATILGYWESNLSNLQIERLKKAKRLPLAGEIGLDQKIKVSLDLDDSGWVEVGTIDGRGSYVDKGQRVSVGALILGRTEVGGGSVSGDIPAYNYRTEFKLQLDLFDKVKIRFEPLGLGYASISEYGYKDLRVKHLKLPPKYR